MPETFFFFFFLPKCDTRFEKEISIKKFHSRLSGPHFGLVELTCPSTLKCNRGSRVWSCPTARPSREGVTARMGTKGNGCRSPHTAVVLSRAEAPPDCGAVSAHWAACSPWGSEPDYSECIPGTFHSRGFTCRALTWVSLIRKYPEKIE